MTLNHTIRYASLTDVGIKRSHNQDACSAHPAPDDKHFRTVGHVFVVADGMGGHAVGEKASAKAVGDIPLTYRKHVAAEGAEAAIRRAFVEANAGIHQIGTNNPEFKGLGTTGTGLFVRPEGAWVGHVGDSRAYRVRGGLVEQLTFDHSWVWEIARRSGQDPDELGDFKRNVIIRSLGPEAEVEVDVEGPHPVLPGDAFVLCSDGLTNHVKADEIGAVVYTFPAEEASRFLIALANLRGGSDNISCVVVQVPLPDGQIHPSTKVRMARPGVFARGLAWWNRRVPWPLTLLAVGGGLIGLSIWLKLADAPGAVSAAAFVLAAVLTLTGVGGLALQLRRRVDTGSDVADAGRELHVYKSYPFEITQKLCDRFAAEEKAVRQSIDGLGVAFDPAVHQKLSAVADATAKSGDWDGAFRTRCLALQALAVPLNNHQRKAEVFKPNYSTTPSTDGKPGGVSG